MTTRRDFVRSAALASAASLAAAVPARAALTLDPSEVRDLLREPITPPPGTPDQVARDEKYWRKVAARYRIIEDATNLEAGYYGMLAAPVLQAFHHNIDRVNRASSYFARREYVAIHNGVKARVAAMLGAKPSEIAFTRSATESLQVLIGQYNGVKAGDTIMYADIDYMAMQWAMNALAQRTGATVARFALPEPGSMESIIAAYTAALDANPGTKLLLLTHCNNKSGLIIPAKELITLAQRRGIDVILDAAHSVGHVPLSLPDLGAPFVGFNLHKWIGAPIGVGVFYIREDRLSSIDRAHADESFPATRIESRVHTGTTHFATMMTVPDALDFHESIGVEHKSARLRFLRDRWAIPARQISGVDILTPDDPGLVGAITSFRIKGRGDRESNTAVVRELLEQHRLFTTRRDGLAKGDCVRVTPALYNTPDDADRLVAALRVMAAR